MPSTDIDGSVIVILSAEEARCVYSHLLGHSEPSIEREILRKIARDLEIEGNEYRGHMYDEMDSEGF